jgi:hypothetical protein
MPTAARWPLVVRERIGDEGVAALFEAESNGRRMS